MTQGNTMGFLSLDFSTPALGKHCGFIRVLMGTLLADKYMEDHVRKNP